MERMIPHNLEAEQGVLGSILIDPDALTEVLPILKAEDFYRESHRLIYSAMLSLAHRSEVIDYLTVNHELEGQNQTSPAGGMGYLLELVNVVPTSANAQYYARIVRDMAHKRRLIYAAGQIAKLAYDGDLNGEQAIEQAEQLLYALQDHQAAGGFVGMGQLMGETLSALEIAHSKRGGLTGITTGFRDLDVLLGGFQKSDLILIGARPSMGKTAFAISMAYRQALKGHKVALFSLEMPRGQLGTRLLSMASQVDLQLLRTGFFEEEEWDGIIEATNNLARLPIFVNDLPGNPLATMRAHLRRLIHEQGEIDIIFIDYLGLIAPDEGLVKESEVRQITEISKGLKRLAREFGVPVVALCQLSRKVEERQNKRPHLADLRMSGSLEQDADVVMFLYRDDYYKEREMQERQEQGEVPPSIALSHTADVIVAKQRNGPVGTVSLFYKGTNTMFYPLEASLE